jgi:hypothetical protein
VINKGQEMLWNRVAPGQSSDQNRNRLDTVEIGDAAMFEAAILNVLNEGLGFRKSAERGTCVLGDERVIPMMSYGLIEYLMGLDLSDFDVLELGGGHSTEFWSLRTRSVLTLETDAEWGRILTSHGLPNVEIRATTEKTIAADMLSLGRSFDAVILDASASRYKCAKAALEVLKPRGFIILDNADWYPNTTALLRDADLIQVDYTDFRPLRWYRCTSSLFLHRRFCPKPLHGRLPLQPIGGKNIAAENDWDRIVD